jgi:hypothetical protein
MIIYSFIVAAVIFVFLYSSVKTEIRYNRWSAGDGESEQFSFSDIYKKVFEQKDLNETKNGFAWRVSYTASAISEVVNKTPNSVPFWNGYSYWPILTKFVPRILWPNKPKEEMGQLFGHTYNLLAEDNLTTSMNNPILAEGYMNFGIFGIIVVTIFMGLIGALVFFRMNIGNVPAAINPLDKFILSSFGVYFIQWESNVSMLFGKLVIILFFRFFLTIIINKY